MLAFLKNVFYFLINFVCLFSFYLFLVFFFITILNVLVKLFLVVIFLIFSIFLSFFTMDILHSWNMYLDLLLTFEIDFLQTFLFYAKMSVVFLIDLLHFLKYFLIEFFNIKNFFGIFYHFYQLINELVYEAVYMFAEQTEDHNMVAEANWMPQYLLGDSLEFSLRANKIFNLFSFSDIVNEKIFIYRRVGVLNSRFWLFRSYTYIHHASENRFRRQTGTLVEPSRWLLDFRDFRVSDYIDPWHLFSNKEVFRHGLFFRKKQYIAVEMMHNYHSIMESVQPLYTERSYSDHQASTFLFFEYFLLFSVYAVLLNVIDEHLQGDLMGLDDEEDVPDHGYQDYESHPFYRSELSENAESKMFANYTFDIGDYTTDDDMSWDFVLAQPLTPRAHVRSDLDDFELVKEMNLLLNEFRSFSFSYPIYKLIYKLSFYSFLDFFLFTDSGKGFKIIFKFFLYIPIGLIIVSIKMFILLIDHFINLPKFFKVVFVFLAFIFFIIYF